MPIFSKVQSDFFISYTYKATISLIQFCFSLHFLHMFNVVSFFFFLKYVSLYFIFCICVTLVLCSHRILMFSVSNISSMLFLFNGKSVQSFGGIYLILSVYLLLFIEYAYYSFQLR